MKEKEQEHQKRKKTTESVNKIWLSAAIISMAVIGLFSAIVHIYFSKDAKLELLQSAYSKALKERNALAPKRLQLTDDLANGVISFEEFLQKKHIILDYNKAEIQRKIAKEPLNKYKESLKIGAWNDPVRLTQFVGTWLFTFIGFLMFISIIKFNLIEKVNPLIVYGIIISYLAIPIMFLVQSILFSFKLMVDFDIITYNIVAFTISVIISILIYRLISWVYILHVSEVRSLKNKIKLLFKFTSYTKKRYIKILISEAITKDNYKQIHDLHNEYEDKLTDTMTKIAEEG